MKPIRVEYVEGVCIVFQKIGEVSVPMAKSFGPQCYWPKDVEVVIARIPMSNRKFYRLHRKTTNHEQRANGTFWLRNFRFEAIKYPPVPDLYALMLGRF